MSYVLRCLFWPWPPTFQVNEWFPHMTLNVFIFFWGGHSTSLFPCLSYSLGIIGQSPPLALRWDKANTPGPSIGAGAKQEVSMWLWEEERRKEGKTGEEGKGRNKSRLGILTSIIKGHSERTMKATILGKPIITPWLRVLFLYLGGNALFVLWTSPITLLSSSLSQTSPGVVWAEGGGPWSESVTQG